MKKTLLLGSLSLLGFREMSGAALITLRGQPAELRIAASSEHSVRIAIQPLNPTTTSTWPDLIFAGGDRPEWVARLRSIEAGTELTVGHLRVRLRPDPLTLTVSDDSGRPLQEVGVDEPSGGLSFDCDAGPVLGLGEGGGGVFDRRGAAYPAENGQKKPTV